jgi:hypothetical protein
MVVPLVDYTYLVVVVIAFLCSLMSFRAGVPFHLKLLALLLGLTVVVELLVRFFLPFFHVKHSSLVYNPFNLVEYWVYGYFFYLLIQVKILRRIVVVFLWIFPIFWVVTTLYLFKFQKYNSYVTVAGSFCIILMVLMYFYQLITAKEMQPIRRMPEFWIVTGILMFYLVELPFFGTLNFFMSYYTTHTAVRDGLLNARLILDTLMYAFISYGYLCLILNTTKSSSS